MPKTQNYTRGVLYSKDSEKNYTLTRVPPSPKLSAIVDTFWHVKWDIGDQGVHQQQNIPDPCVNIIFKENTQEVVGVISKRYSTILKDKGHIFGIKFCAGAFSLLCNIDQSELCDKTLPLMDVFGDRSLSLIEKVNNTKDIHLKIKACEAFLGTLLPSSNENINQLKTIINYIEWNPSITKVSQLVSQFGCSERNLQRIFKNQLGISPKWIIKKYRIQEVLSQFEDGDYNWPDLLERLGYFDQSHFIKDFKNFIGLTPNEYIKHIRNF